MKKTFILIFLLLFSFFLLPTFDKEVEAAATQDAKGNWSFDYVSQLDENYYKTLDGITEKTAFELELHRIISTDAKKFSYSDTTEQLRYLDEHPNDTSSILCMYTGKTMSKSANGSSGTTTWNKEHTWAKSHGFPSNSATPYSDIIHLRATECQANSNRGNSDFGETSGTPDAYGNKFSNSITEPRDCVKGDIARIMMYMDVRYAGDATTDSGIKLTLVNKAQTSGPEFGHLDTLLKWHQEDPVDDLERRRNDRAQERQGNRNPFVDHPEYANIIYSLEPVKPTFTVTFNVPSTINYTYKDNALYEENMLVTKPTVDPSGLGYRFDGWYKESTFATKWDFATDKITKNITLYAKMTEVEITAAERIRVTKTNAALSFDYTTSTEEGGGPAVSATETLGFNGPGAMTQDDAKTILFVDVSTCCTFNTDLFEIKAYYNAKPNFYVNDKQMRLYNCAGDGTSVVVKAKSGVTITGLDIVSNNDSYLKITVSPTGDQAEVKNINEAIKNNVQITSFKINYTTGPAVTYEFSNVKLAFSYELSKTAYDKIVADWNAKGTTDELKFAFEVNGAQQEAKKEEKGDKVVFSYVTEVNPLTTSYEVYAVMLEGSNVVKNAKSTCSVASMLNAYLTNHLDMTLVKRYEKVLKAFQNKF